ncbi:L,D-transpeptidase [Patescibacteria group bacterium]|nr:L,D-transpeptidase [Patescibacteria group bacterium]
MKTRIVIVNLLAALFIVAAIAGQGSADVKRVMRTSVLHVDEEKPVVQEESCAFEMPEKAEYNAEVVSVRRKLKVENEELVKVKVFMKNSGNMPWFSYQSKCKKNPVYLGTQSEMDHNSSYFTVKNPEDNNWITPNRIAMDQLRVDPGEVASFTFYLEPDMDDDVFAEFFAPVVEGVTWLEDAGFSVEVIVGEPDDSLSNIRTRLLFASETGSLMGYDLENGERKILVDLSDQEMTLSIDNFTVKKFKVSTGASKTPTPVGMHSIKLKQEVRVGGKAPHYIMPKFMWFKDGGYGIHALPSLRTDGGVFWTEARNHIGIPVSHGCIRLLPEHADLAYEFADIGTTVEVQR